MIDDVDEESNPEMVVPTPAPTTEAPPPPYQPDFAAPPQQPETPVVDTPVDGTLPKHNVEENPPHTTDRETHPVDVSGGVAKAGDRQVSFFAQPGILAGQLLHFVIPFHNLVSIESSSLNYRLHHLAICSQH